MPQPATTNRRRARSTEIQPDIAELRRIEKRRDENARLFDDLIRDTGDEPTGLQWTSRISATAHNDSFVDYNITTSEETDDLLHYLNSLRFELRQLLLDAWTRSPYGGVSFNLEVLVEYFSFGDPSITSLKILTSKYYPIYTIQNIADSCASASIDILEENDYYQEGASDWVIDRIIRSVLKYQFVQPSRVMQGGGRFNGVFRRPGPRKYIKEPMWLSNKKCLINIQNEDDCCFKYVMECAFHHKMTGQTLRNPHRVQHYLTDHFQYGDLVFPIHPLDIDKFIHLNKTVHNLALHVYSVTETKNDIGVLYKPSQIDPDAWHVHLLIIADITKRGAQIDYHWIYIKNVQKFLSTNLISKSGSHRVCCEWCTQDFAENKIERHKLQCGKEDAATPILPQPYEKYKYFKDMDKTFRRLFVIYADFEAFLTPVSHHDTDTITEASRVQEHVCASFCFLTVCATHPQFNRTVIFSYDHSDIDDKELVGKRFIEELDKENSRIQKLFKKHFLHPLDLSSVVEGCTHCYICRLELENGFMPHWKYRNYRKKNDFKNSYEFFARIRKFKQKPLPNEFQDELFRENCQIVDIWDSTSSIGNFLGKAHFACAAHRPKDTTYRLEIPVVFHNLGNYDAHFILKSMNTGKADQATFHGIPKSSDKFMSFSYGRFKFMDSIRFMNSSLDKLSQNLLKAGKDKFRNFNAHFHYLTPEQKSLLLQKGEFPYDYFTHPSVFADISLPPIERFYNHLREQPMKPEDYQKALHVWDSLECKTFRDYHDLYLIIDVLLLADVFENFREVSYGQYGVDPTNYISLPGLAIDAAYRFAGSRYSGGDHIPFAVDLFDCTQADMYSFIEDSIRGGISMTPGRYAKANHKYLLDFDPSLPSRFINYWDANNLYGWAMNQCLPFAEYRWLTDKQIRDLEFMQISPDHPVGYFLEVDGFFPDGVHDYLSDFPPAPLKQKVSDAMISPFSKAMHAKYDQKHDSKTEKLLCTLEPRTFYKCYYSTLQLYCKLGFVVRKIHRILSFCQAKWMANFINYNTAQRAKATNDFETDFFKLINNCSYGKFIQNNRKHCSMKRIPRDAPRHTWSIDLTNRRIVNKDFVIGTFKNGKVNLDSAVAVGSVVLDQSKILMYDFFYNVLKREYGNSLRLIFTDTDSVCVEIIHEDLMLDLKSKGLLSTWFDVSHFPNNDDYYGRNYHDPLNKKVIGKFKDEMVDKSPLYITEVVALRAKMYSCLKSDGSQKHTAKGMLGPVRMRLLHTKYLKAVMQDPSFSIEKDYARSFESTNNVIHTVTVTKDTINPCDSKLFILDALHSRPYGHYSTRSL